MPDSTRNMLTGKLKQSGLSRGDTVLVHSDATAIRDLSGLKWSEALTLLKESILDVIGPSGTLVVPTFNWDFCSGKKYRHEKTRSQVGMFSQNVLSDKRSIRSLHPIYSFSAIGPYSHRLFENISKSSFGNDSVFSRLHEVNAKMLFFNVPFEVCTFIHYVEQMRGVDYRFLKKFTGEIDVSGDVYTDTFDFYARYLDREVINYFGRLSELLINEGLMSNLLLQGKYSLMLTDCNTVYTTTNEQLDLHPYYLLKSPPLAGHSEESN